MSRKRKKRQRERVSCCLCIAKKDVPPGTYLPSDVQLKPCDGCGEPIYVSPYGIEFAQRIEGAKLFCQACHQDWVKDDPSGRSTYVVFPPGYEEQVEKWRREYNERN